MRAILRRGQVSQKGVLDQLIAQSRWTDTVKAIGKPKVLRAIGALRNSLNGIGRQPARNEVEDDDRIDGVPINYDEESSDDDIPLSEFRFDPFARQPATEYSIGPMQTINVSAVASRHHKIHFGVGSVRIHGTLHRRNESYIVRKSGYFISNLSNEHNVDVRIEAEPIDRINHVRPVQWLTIEPLTTISRTTDASSHTIMLFRGEVDISEGNVFVNQLRPDGSFSYTVGPNIQYSLENLSDEESAIVQIRMNDRPDVL